MKHDPSARLNGYQVSLLPVKLEHLDQLRRWRNSDHVKQHMLTRETITEEQQLAWFAHISRSTNQQHYVIEYRDQLIGSCNIKVRGALADINLAQHYELGLYIGELQFIGNIIAFAPTLVLNDYCFTILHADTLFAVVKAENQAALRYNQKLGYQVERSDDLIELTLTKEDYQQQSQLLKRLLDRPSRKPKKG